MPLLAAKKGRIVSVRAEVGQYLPGTAPHGGKVDITIGLGISRNGQVVYHHPVEHGPQAQSHMPCQHHLHLFTSAGVDANQDAILLKNVEN